MIQLTSRELAELKSCKQELEGVLELLDAAGAGIAAIHVSAAIEQLKANLLVLTSNDISGPRHCIFPEANQ